MKKTITTKKLIGILLALFLLSFTTNKKTYQTECVSLDTDGYVTIKIWDTKKGKSYMPEQARKDAIDAVLFSGIAGNNGYMTQNPMLTKTNEMEQFQKIEKDFFRKNGLWATYTREANTETTIPTTIGDKKWKVYSVSVAKNLLHKYLEDQKIIKSLNSGF